MFEPIADVLSVSVILTTRDRPTFLSIALACYRHQTYAHRELIVIDDGELFPADEQAVAAVGGRLIRAKPGTSLGEKLNLGVEAADGFLCQKMDDDDWYAPEFLSAMVSGVLASWSVVAVPTLAVVTPFLFFDLATWQIRQSLTNNVPGATLMFRRDMWEERRFRGLSQDEDVWFILDHLRLGAMIAPVRQPEIFLAVRHGTHPLDRGHTWTHQWDGQLLEDYMQESLSHYQEPEALLPRWAVDAYRRLQGQAAGGRK